MSDKEEKKEQKPVISDPSQLSNEQLEKASGGAGTASARLLLPFYLVDTTSSGQDDGDDAKASLEIE